LRKVLAPATPLLLAAQRADRRAGCSNAIKSDKMVPQRGAG